MLALLRGRLSNDPPPKIRIAAEEQAKITALRLQHSEAARQPRSDRERPAGGARGAHPRQAFGSDAMVHS
jgi:hypothetical protein